MGLGPQATQDLTLLELRGQAPASSGGHWGVEVRMGRVDPRLPLQLPFLTPTCTLI